MIAWSYLANNREYTGLVGKIYFYHIVTDGLIFIVQEITS